MVTPDEILSYAGEVQQRHTESYIYQKIKNLVYVRGGEAILRELELPFLKVSGPEPANLLSLLREAQEEASGILKTARGPHTQGWLDGLIKNGFFEALHEVRLLKLHPNQILDFHSRPAEGGHSLNSLMLPLNCPSNCLWVFQRWGKIPYECGRTIAIDPTYAQAAVNSSDETQYILELRGRIGPAFHSSFEHAVGLLRIEARSKQALEKIRNSRRKNPPRLKYSIWEKWDTIAPRQYQAASELSQLLLVRASDTRLQIDRDYLLHRILDDSLAGADWAVILTPGTYVKNGFGLELQKALRYSPHDSLIAAVKVGSAQSSFDSKYFAVNLERWQQLGRPGIEIDPNGNLSSSAGVQYFELPESVQNLVEFRHPADPSPERPSWARDYTDLVIPMDSSCYWEIDIKKNKRRLSGCLIGASGLLDLVILDGHGVTPETQIVYFDRSIENLNFKRLLNETWNGVNLPQFLKNYAQDFTFSSNIDEEWQRELRHWGSEDNLRKKFFKFRTLRRHYVNLDIQQDFRPLLTFLDLIEGEDFAIHHGEIFCAKADYPFDWHRNLEVRAQGLAFVNAAYQCASRLGKNIFLYGRDIIYGTLASPDPIYLKKPKSEAETLGQY